MKNNNELSQNILGNLYSKITILDVNTNKEIAVITNELVNTASDSIVVKLTPKYD